MPASNSETGGRFCDGLGSNIVVQYFVRSIITLHGRITAKDYVDKMGQSGASHDPKSFPNNDAVFQDENVPIHIAGTVQSWFEEHEGELQHRPWPAQLPYLNIAEPLWSVLETKSKEEISTSNISKIT
jgi:hypothetical protein